MACFGFPPLVTLRLHKSRLPSYVSHKRLLLLEQRDRHVPTRPGPLQASSPLETAAAGLPEHTVAPTADPLSGVAVWCPRSLVAERSVSIQSPSHSSLTLGRRGYRPRVKITPLRALLYMQRSCCWIIFLGRGCKRAVTRSFLIHTSACFIGDPALCRQPVKPVRAQNRKTSLKIKYEPDH